MRASIWHPITDIRMLIALNLLDHLHFPKDRQNVPNPTLRPSNPLDRGKYKLIFVHQENKAFLEIKSCACPPRASPFSLIFLASRKNREFRFASPMCFSGTGEGFFFYFCFSLSRQSPSSSSSSRSAGFGCGSPSFLASLGGGCWSGSVAYFVENHGLVVGGAGFSRLRTAETSLSLTALMVRSPSRVGSCLRLGLWFRWVVWLGLFFTSRRVSCSDLGSGGASLDSIQICFSSWHGGHGCLVFLLWRSSFVGWRRSSRLVPAVVFGEVLLTAVLLTAFVWFVINGSLRFIQSLWRLGPSPVWLWAFSAHSGKVLLGLWSSGVVCIGWSGFLVVVLYCSFFVWMRLDLLSGSSW